VIVLDRRAPQSLTWQIQVAIRRAIARGNLPPRSALPSTRALAARLGVSRNTVLGAYEALAAEGLIGGRRGSGTRVAELEGDVESPIAHSYVSVRRVLRAAHYPVRAVRIRDSEGNVVTISSI
jgi:DNA-binding GntR family transcriptional regulator